MHYSTCSSPLDLHLEMKQNGFEGSLKSHKT